MSDRIQVKLRHQPEPGEVEAVERVLRDAGLEAEVEDGFTPDQAIGDGPWAITVLEFVGGGTLLAYLAAIATHFGKKHAESLDAALTRFFRALKGARPNATLPTGWFQLKDSRGTSVGLSGDEPPEALSALLELDPEEWGGRHVEWDAEAGQWYDPKERYEER